MDSQKARIIRSSEVKSFVLNETYSSRMLLDDLVAGEPSVHINEGTLKGGGKTGGATHTAPEIYYVVGGEAIFHTDGPDCDITPGTLIFIPPGTFHALTNKSQTADFVLLTIWKSVEGNEVYDMRVKAWGTAFKTIHDD